MSHLIDLIAMADHIAQRVNGKVATSNLEVSPTGPTRARFRVTCLKAELFPQVGNYTDRIHVWWTGNEDGFAWLDILGEPGEDPEVLVQEAIDYLTRTPSTLTETEVLL